MDVIGCAHIEFYLQDLAVILSCCFSAGSGRMWFLNHLASTVTASKSMVLCTCVSAYAGKCGYVYLCPQKTSCFFAQDCYGLFM